MKNDLLLLLLLLLYRKNNLLKTLADIYREKVKLRKIKRTIYIIFIYNTLN